MLFSMLVDWVGIGFYIAAVYYDTQSIFTPNLVSVACSLTGLHSVSVVINMYALKSSALAGYKKKPVVKKPSTKNKKSTDAMNLIEDSGMVSGLKTDLLKTVDLKTIIKKV